MKNIYPTNLIARPEHAPLNRTDIRIGDTVYLQPKEGPKIAGTVIFSSGLYGCNTYTADAILDDKQGQIRLRLRFREQDIHHVDARRPVRVN